MPVLVRLLAKKFGPDCTGHRSCDTPSPLTSILGVTAETYVKHFHGKIRNLDDFNISCLQIILLVHNKI